MSEQTNNLCMERISTNKLILEDDNGKASSYLKYVCFSEVTDLILTVYNFVLSKSFLIS